MVCINRKGLLRALPLWYAPTSLWHRVPYLGNLHDAWIMNVLVTGISLITTQKDFPTRTIPYILYICYVFWHLSLMRAEGCSIQEIAEALAPWPGRRRTVREILFRQFSQFLRFYGVWSDLRRIIRTILFLLMKPGKKLPRCLYSWRIWFESISVWQNVLHKILMILQPTN